MVRAARDSLLHTTRDGRSESTYATPPKIRVDLSINIQTRYSYDMFSVMMQYVIGKFVGNGMKNEGQGLLTPSTRQAGIGSSSGRSRRTLGRERSLE